MSDTDTVLCDCTILCQPCAGEWVYDHADRWPTYPQPAEDATRRLRAAVRLAFRHHRQPTADQIRRQLADAPVLLADAVNHCPWLGPPIGSPAAVAHAYAMVGPRHERAERTRAALALFDSEVHALWSWETSDNRSGEWCEACGDQLEPAWVTCDNCDHDGDEYSFPYVTGADPVDEGDGNGPHVARCGHCTDVD